jgi:predicted MPP superfamily phosphohydrolase
MTIRWLHLSDVHECERQGHLRKRMYDNIIEKGIKGQPPPDLVFLTGDLAFAGQNTEYQSLHDEFITPLKNVLKGCPIFTVPGNHDVDRDRAIKPRVWIKNPDEEAIFQSTDSKGATKRKDALLPRFAAYAAFDQRVSDWGSAWLESDLGAVWWCKKVNDVKLAIVGCNTAWLCQDEEDWGKLTPGRYMIERAIEEAQKQKPDLLIVLGHHPLDALSVEGPPGDGQRVRDRLMQANAIYLHGHLHEGGSDQFGDVLRSTLAIQAPSAFQHHDSKRWRNGLMWGTLDFSSKELSIQPRLWDEKSRQFKWDTYFGYSDYQVPAEEAFRLPLPGRSNVSRLVPSASEPKVSTGLGRFFDDTQKLLETKLIEIAQHVQGVFNAMTENDLMVLLLTNEDPLEWSSGKFPEIKREAALALRRGASFCYLIPSDHIIRRYGAKMGLRTSVSDFKLRFDRFVDDLRKYSEDTPTVTKPGIVALLTHSAAGFMAPYHKYALYKTAFKDAAHTVGAFPVRIENVHYMEEGHRVVLPLTAQFHKDFYEFILRTLSDFDKNNCVVRVSPKGRSFKEFIDLMEGVRRA